MPPLPAQPLLDTLRLNSGMIKRQLNGISHEETLIQPPFQANCMNWTLGHLLTSRDAMLELLSLPPVLTPTEKKIYDRGSLPLADSAIASPLESLLGRHETSARQLRAALESASQSSLEMPCDFGGGMPLGEALAFLLWHETCHTGQLELLRQLAGKNDQVIK